MEGKSRSKDTNHQSFSWLGWAEQLANLARVSSGERSEEVRTGETEHVNKCSASPAETILDQHLEEIMQAFAAPEWYPDEPRIDLGVWLQEIKEKERERMAVQPRKKGLVEVMGKYRRRNVLVLFAGVLMIGVVLIVSLPGYSSVLALVQCLLMALFFMMTRQRKGEKHRVKHSVPFDLSERLRKEEKPIECMRRIR